MSKQGERIRQFRKSLKLSQEKFAQVVKVSAQTVHRWENNKSEPLDVAMEALKRLGYKE
jgi:DNA-binding transcriptional regulator YiaG